MCVRQLGTKYLAFEAVKAACGAELQLRLIHEGAAELSLASNTLPDFLVQVKQLRRCQTVLAADALHILRSWILWEAHSCIQSCYIWATGCASSDNQPTEMMQRI